MFENRFIRALRIDWNKIPEHSYLHRITALSGLTDLSFSKNITFFVGENGTGKSTLLEAIAAGYGFNPEGGTPVFPLTMTCRSSAQPLLFPKASAVRRPAIFSGRRASLT